MVVNQGDIYWFPAEEQSGAEPGNSHPHVVIQVEEVNQSSKRVVICRLTSNLKQVKAPGNILLEAGEANLLKRSVVVVSQTMTVETGQLGAYIGSLGQPRVKQILSGMRFLELMTERGKQVK
jgi:mRNA interferase MazF